LDKLGRPYTLNHRLVRGLDYYTKTVFEVWAQGIGAQSAICGGGRYDGLAEELGGAHTPGIGFGSGMERLVMTMKEQGIEVPGAPTPQVAVAYLGPAAKSAAVSLVTDLRAQGLRTVMAFGDRSLKAQLRNANRKNVAYAIIVGEDELARGEVTIQDMLSNAPREQVQLIDAVGHLKGLLG